MNSDSELNFILFPDYNQIESDNDNCESQIVSSNFPTTIEPITSRTFNCQHFSVSFRYAIECGDLKLAKNIATRFPLIDVTATYNNQTEYAFRTACSNNKLDLARWMKSSWPEINHRVDNDDIIRKAIALGHNGIVLWLLTLYRWHERREILDIALESNNQKIIDYIRHHDGFSIRYTHTKSSPVKFDESVEKTPYMIKIKAARRQY